MKFWWLPIIALTSCGGLDTFPWGSSAGRQVASYAEVSDSAAHQELDSQIDEKLSALYRYSLLVQKYLRVFDNEIASKELSELYQSDAYLNLMAAKIQIDEIENQLRVLGAKPGTKKRDEANHQRLRMKISTFAKESPVHALTVSNLAVAVGLDDIETKELSSSELEAALRPLDSEREFMIYEKNIEHQAHMLDIKIRGSGKKLKSLLTQSSRAVNGLDLPSKVWSLTFAQGPTAGLTEKIIESLKSRGLKATFFQVTEKALASPETVKLLKSNGSEIASHSYSHKELSKVGAPTLETEISGARIALEKNFKVKIRFMLLPYGTGLQVPLVRELLAENNLTYVLWSVDSLDWVPQSPDRIVTRTKRLMKKTPQDSGIILFHDLHPRSLGASQKIMDELLIDARRTCTLSKLIKDISEDSGSVCSER